MKHEASGWSRRRPVPYRSVAALLVAVGLAGTVACVGSSAPPVVTLTVLECASGDIGVSATVTKVQASGNKWRINVVGAVTCKGAPVKAQVQIKVAGGWWTQTIDTDAAGKLSATGPAKDGDPGGQSLTITVQGTDAPRAATFSVP